MTHQAPMRGTHYRVKVVPGTDEECIAQFERWLVVTGRMRYVDWKTVKVDRTRWFDYNEVYVVAFTK